MRASFLLISFVFSLFHLSSQNKSDSLYFTGDIGTWLHSNNNYPLSLGARIVPSLTYDYLSENKHKFSVNAAAYAWGVINTNFDDYNSDGEISLYRLAGSYSYDNFSFSLGLQDISFGSARMLRPLMWFDLLDPRDPMKITDGVYSAYGTYTFSNSSKLSLWSLYGNDNLRGWDWSPSVPTIPEFGGRYKYPFERGHMAFSYHHRMINVEQESQSTVLGERKYGFDMRLNYTFGAWVEASWNNINNKGLYLFSNQSLLTIGIDREIEVGNGLYFAFEHMLVSYHQSAFSFDNSSNISALEVSYPISNRDKFKSIIFYDWDNKQGYTFVEWERTFKRLSAHLMAYVNADDTRLPNLRNLKNMYQGPGIQLMFVYRF